ncbi:hypothetical protein D7028_12900 [Serratia marcescens]|nr:hypothetical protein C7M66_00380 [Serratia marcescens]AXX24869.1 hypothetical protein C7M65_12745 [Serratia marcescens]RTE99233.1 hypothetical protein C7M70_12365 [Serratia marcescens]RTF00643.1 hypothetical protein C7M68_17345 [Serratia marcescens]RTF08513.1 hypothetical protein C7M69_08585 [Serratia marcescens]
MKPYSGTRKAIDLSNAYLDPDKLFTAHKNRVVADGGTILNEASCKNEIAFIINLGLWDNMASVASPEWGIKQDGSGNILKMYGLGNTPDYTATQFGTALHPVTLDTTREIPLAIIKMDGGGSQLVSGAVVLQGHASLPYAVSVRGIDYDITDNQGIAARFNGPSWPHFYYWCINRQAQKFKWFYSCDQFNPPTGAGGASASKVWDGTIGRSAALVSPIEGKLRAYDSGAFSSESSSLPPPNISGITGTITLGTRYANEQTIAGAAYGGIGRVRVFSICNDAAASQISARA